MPISLLCRATSSMISLVTVSLSVKSYASAPVVLAGDGELRTPHGLSRVLLLDARGVVEYLARGGEELLALARHRYSAVGAREYRDAQLLLERAYGLGEGGLRDEHAPRRLADRSVGCNRIRISHLLKRHTADIIRFTSAACLPPHDGLKRRAAASDRVEGVGERADDVVYVLDSD